MTSPFEHLYVLEDRLDREKRRLAEAKNQKERAFREHEIRMVEREVEGEKKFLAARGLVVSTFSDFSDSDLLDELLA